MPMEDPLATLCIPMRSLRRTCSYAAMLALTASAGAQTAFNPFETPQEAPSFGDSRDRVHVVMEADSTHVPPGGDVVIAIALEHEPHWHAHTHDPDVPPELGDAEDYIATEVHVEVAEGSPLIPHVPFMQWPEPTVVQVAFAGTPVDYAVLSDEAVAYLPISVDPSAVAGTEATMRIRVVFQACDDTVCLMPTPRPGTPGWEEYGKDITFTIVDPIDMRAAAGSSDRFSAFDASVFSSIHSGDAPPGGSIDFDAFGLQFSLDTGGGAGLILLLLVAMVGGFLLNLTPCVLPVIPIKIMGLSASAGNRRRTLLLGIWMMLGVMSLWLALGLAIAFVSGFTAINQLFQYPLFTILLGLFIAVMAIGMGGLFSIRLPNAIYMINPKHDTWYGSFLFGIMTAVLSTPCTAPFMGAAAAWAATQSATVTLAVFAAIGIGMGIPYLILAAFPQLIDRMPKAGPASEVIKQVMGLLMLAAAAYFLGVGLSGLAQQEGAPVSRLYLWAVVACTAASGLWLAWRTMRLARRTGIRIGFVGLGLLMAAASLAAGVRLTDRGPIDWEYYTPELLTERLAEGDVVVLEFTAEWCLNCKLLENTVLHSRAVVELFDDPSVTPMKIDLTGNNAAGNALLAEVGGLRIPLLIVLGPDGKEIFRGDFYTVDQVVRAVNGF